MQAGYGGQPPMPGPGYPQAPGAVAPYCGTSGYAGYGQGWWSGPGQPGGIGSIPPLPYPVPYQN